MRALELLDIDVGRIGLYISFEIDKDCAKVVSRAWRGVEHFSDLGDVSDRELRELFESRPELRYGLVIGGFPCQPFSALNADRVGFEDPRSDTFLLMVELVERLRSMMPDILWHDLFENVASMVDADRHAITERLKKLHDRVLFSPNFQQDLLPGKLTEWLPYRVDAAAFGHVNRPWYYWTSWEVAVIEADCCKAGPAGNQSLGRVEKATSRPPQADRSEGYQATRPLPMGVSGLVNTK